jgi:hypothetical protein
VNSILIGLFTNVIFLFVFTAICFSRGYGFFVPGWFFVIAILPLVFLITKNNKMAVGALLGVPIYFVFIMIIYFVLGYSEVNLETKRTDFVKQCLTSINNGTDFYRNNSTEEAILQVQFYRSKISNNYEIIGYRMPEWCQYYYYIVFDKTNKFEIFVTSRPKLTLQRLFYDEKAVKNNLYTQQRSNQRNNGSR